MKLRKSDLKRVLNGEISLAEAKKRAKLLEDTMPAVQVTNPEMLENDSLDVQVDRFLMQGESDSSKQAMGMAPQTESLLREEGEDAGAAPVTDPAQQQEPPSPQPTGGGQDLDLVTFADNLARLIEKHETLLDIKGTIVRRALNYVTKNYDAKQSKELAQILEGNFGITVDGKDPYDDDQAPPAQGAGSSLQQA